MVFIGVVDGNGLFSKSVLNCLADIAISDYANWVFHRLSLTNILFFCYTCLVEKVFKNSSILVAAQTMVKAISFFYTLFLARSLGVASFGLYVVALSYFSLITSVSDFGISRYLMREVARGEKNTKTLLSHIVFLRLTILSIVFAVFALAVYFLDPDKLRVSLSLFAVLAILPQSVALSIDNIFIALQKMSLSAIGILVLSVANTLVGIFFVLTGKGVMGATIALLAAEAVYALFIFLLLLREKITIIPKLEKSLFSDILKGSLPYGILGILGLVYFKIDSLMLSYLKGSYDTGIYGISYKFLEAAVFVPTAVGTAFFPVLTRLHVANLEEMKKVCFRIFKSMSVLGLMVLVCYVLVLPLVIRFFLPQYLPSITAIEILSLSIPFMFVHVPLSQVLLSSDRYLKGVIGMSIVNVLFNVVLNFIFIPKFGYIGASWITVFSDIFSLALLGIFIKRYIFSHA